MRMGMIIMLMLCSFSTVSYAKGGNSAASRANTRSLPLLVQNRQRPVRQAVDKGTQLVTQTCQHNYVDTKSQKHWCYALPNKWYNSIHITLKNPHRRTAFSDEHSDVVVKFLNEANQMCFPQMSSNIGKFGIGNYFSEDNIIDCLHDTNDVCTVPITNILPPENCVKVVVIAHVSLTVEQVTLKVDDNNIDLYEFKDEDGTSSNGTVFSIFIGMFIMCIFYCCISSNNHSDHDYYNRDVIQQYNDPYSRKTRCSPEDIDVGLRVQTQYTIAEGGDGRWYTGTIVRIYDNLEVKIKYDDGDDWTGSIYDVYHIDRDVTQQHNYPYARKTRCSPEDIRVGDDVQTLYTIAEGGDGKWYTGTIVRIYDNLEVKIKYDDGDDWTGSINHVYYA